MTRIVKYTDSNGTLCKVTLLHSDWRLIRGVWVLRGKQLINGRLVNRSIAAHEIAPNGIQVKGGGDA
jgi:hypothetical protein